jgi:nucleoid-associated protein YgaU
MRTKSACVVLAWSVLIIGAAVGLRASVRPAQANTRTAGSGTEVILTSTLSAAPAAAAAPSPSTRYVVQDGDTLSSIAARFAVPGGWPALYAANRPVIGPDPNVIHSGAVLVLPGVQVPARYTVVAGDTLSGIAARFAVRGGWPALYAANRRVIGPDPNTIRPGIVLVISRSAISSPPVSTPSPPKPAPASAPSGSQHRPQPAPTSVPPATGMPQWLKTVLLAAGLIIGLAFLVEPVLMVRRRHRRAAQAAQAARDAEAAQAAETAQATDTAEAEAARAAETAEAAQAAEAAEAAAAAQRSTADPGREPEPTAADRAHVVLADYDRLVVTYSQADDTVYVLRPPGEDPRKVLRAARLVLPEGSYGELADQLGVPPSWPME